MRKIKIVTDSTCDLPDRIIEENNIAVIPLYVVFGSDTYKDGIEISTQKLYKMVDKNNKLPGTAAPAPSDFIDAFKKYINQDMDIIYIGLSSKLSSTIQNAEIAAQDFGEDRIKVIDSLNLSTGIGLLVMKAVDYIKLGYTIDEIVKKIQDLIPKVKTRFIINKFDYLYKGGRCTSIESIVGSLLKIKPVIAVEQGKIVLEEKIRGRREKVLKLMLNKVLKDKSIIDGARIFITHTMSEKEAEYLKKELKNNLDVKNVLISEAGCVISSHCGPETIGILYILS